MSLNVIFTKSNIFIEINKYNINICILNVQLFK